MASKKSFKADINPTMQFISAQPEATLSASAAPDGFRINPLYVETKSRRLQLLVQPSLHQKLKARATAEGKSVNELVHSILEHALIGD